MWRHLELVCMSYTQHLQFSLSVAIPVAGQPPCVRSRICAIVVFQVVHNIGARVANQA